MPVLPIITIPNSVLSTKCSKVKDLDTEAEKIMTNLEETLWEGRFKGVGLAAPQLGYTQRIFAAHRSLKKDQDPVKYMFVNPEITKFSTATEIGWEGCLSIPDTYCKVKRSKEIVVEYMDKNGEKQKTRASGFFARIIQHELDHLDGILITHKCIGEPKTEKELDAILANERDQNA
ncbi:peptide deformylase [Patescibacteria group bacterium]|nr:peptide deformylase [Patescibacteria group bacterium]